MLLIVRTKLPCGGHRMETPIKLAIVSPNAFDLSSRRTLFTIDVLVVIHNVTSGRSVDRKHVGSLSTKLMDTLRRCHTVSNMDRLEALQSNTASAP